MIERRADANKKIYRLLTALRAGALPGRYRELRSLIEALLNFCGNCDCALGKLCEADDPCGGLLRGFGVPILRMALPALPDRQAAVRDRIEVLLNRIDADPAAAIDGEEIPY